MYFPSGDFSHYKSLTDVVEEHGKHMTHYHDPPGWILLMCLFNPLQHYPEASASESLHCQPFLVQTPVPTGTGRWELPGGELAWLLGKQQWRAWEQARSWLHCSHGAWERVLAVRAR